jgi:hypothetical protein
VENNNKKVNKLIDLSSIYNTTYLKLFGVPSPQEIRKEEDTKKLNHLVYKTRYAEAAFLAENLGMKKAAREYADLTVSEWRRTKKPKTIKGTRLLLSFAGRFNSTYKNEIEDILRRLEESKRKVGYE